MLQIDTLLESLPPNLAERSRWLGSGDVAREGQFVLYWMRTAIRRDENPALNVAIELANRLELPLLVYQGLTERYPFASDRHHTFVLQAAKDVQRELADAAIPYVLHVERDGHRGPHLKSLGLRAAVVVTEDMPTEPLRRWTARLGKTLPSGIVAVDTACVVPSCLVGRSYERAFEFRDATRKLYAERVSLAPSDSELQAQSKAAIALPFDSVNLQDCDIASLVRQCRIDHSVGPVPHTAGGCVAGYKRWQQFKDKGLSTYDRSRNNPLVDGVSRMSPYLHYGMVAATRIAREAAHAKSKGAEKYLDELLIWRELAYAFCHYRPDHERISAIPNWARQTLAAHEGNPRELLSWETMSRGRTGDSLWDAAQRSLLIHGELHNNVRMTWGKAILNWTPDAKQALARMIDLNHRYALDGRDPASYGGILWCLGQFDRPFTPENPIFGTVRARGTEQHAKRLDPAAYRRKTARPLWVPTPTIAVIGAGISGLMCARTLSDHGLDVTVFDKSRGVSGRMSTRRADDGLTFNHGAQYFTAHSDSFKRYVRSWAADGIVAPWSSRIVVIENGIVKAEKSAAARYVATPGMNSLGKHLAEDLNVQLGTQISAARRSGEKWTLTSQADADLGKFDELVIAVPSHQAEPLLPESSKIRQRASQIKMNGCWALMLAFDQPLGVDFGGAFVHESPLSWVARNSGTAPGDRDYETWVLHASAKWTEQQIEDSPEHVKQSLMDAFWDATGLPPTEPAHINAHRWRFAIPSEPLADRCLYDDKLRIGACGDWCGGPRVEGAFLSGIELAGRILGQINASAVPADTKVQQLALF